jgi:hypothetical protein
VHGDHEFRIVSGNHHANELAADIANIARVTTLISVYLDGIENH